ncbi:MAG: alpha/beta hydrolase [Planctomycetes bacterium]|nr:alpha/beta hydrolase [Planctomycetota bacterium]
MRHCLLLVACAALAAAEPATTCTYATAAGRELQLDLHRPAAATGPLPVAVWIHGGGWRSGARRDCRPALQLIARHPRYAVASLDYRLTGEALWPAQLDDCRAALRWLREHGAEHGVDGTRIAVMGSSAGGHLAAMLGTTAAEAGLPVVAVVDWFGPADLATPSDDPAVQRAVRPGQPIHALLGGTPQERPEAARAASPVRFVDRGDPPFLIIHGDADPVVPVAQSRSLNAALAAAGAVSELVEVPGGGHGGPAFTDAAVLDRAARLLDAAFAGRPPAAAAPATAPAAQPAATSATAAPSAGAPARRLERDGERWSLDAPGGRIGGFIALPPGRGPFPALLVSHGKGGAAAGFGRQVATHALGWGMAVMACDYTHAGNGSPGGDGASTENLHRAQATLAALAALPEVDPARIAAYGHSMGGFVTIALAARAGGALRAAAVTGSGLAAGEGFPAPTAAAAAGIRIPVLMLHGDGDRVVPPERSLLLERVLGQSGTPCRRTILAGAGHNLLQERPVEVATTLRAWFAEHGLVP